MDGDSESVGASTTNTAAYMYAYPWMDAMGWGQPGDSSRSIPVLVPAGDQHVNPETWDFMYGSTPSSGQSATEPILKSSSSDAGPETTSWENGGDISGEWTLRRTPTDGWIPQPGIRRTAPNGAITTAMPGTRDRRSLPRVLNSGNGN
ncbi:hypothetical protein HDU93_006922, partial [Gonapodya sp. JEL0774]